MTNAFPQTMIVLYRTVEKENLACTMKSGSLPVLATPQMIAWMEEAACLAAPLQEGQTSVGIHMDCSHDAPSLEGARIRIEAVLEEVKGKILTYKVSAWNHDECIGKGRHQRALVWSERFMEKARGSH